MRTGQRRTKRWLGRGGNPSHKEPPPTKHSSFFSPPASPTSLPHVDPSVPQLLHQSLFSPGHLSSSSVFLTPFPPPSPGYRQTHGPVSHLLTSLLMCLLSEVPSLPLPSLPFPCCLHTMTPSQSCRAALLPTRFPPPPLPGPQDTVFGKQCPPQWALILSILAPNPLSPQTPPCALGSQYVTCPQLPEGEDDFTSSLPSQTTSPACSALPSSLLHQEASHQARLSGLLCALPSRPPSTCLTEHPCSRPTYLSLLSWELSEGQDCVSPTAGSAWHVRMQKWMCHHHPQVTLPNCPH